MNSTSLILIASRLSVAVALTTLAACVPQQAPAPAPQTQRPGPAAPRPLPPPPPLPSSDWRDLPLTPGIWSYQDLGASSRAQYGPRGAEPGLILSCDKTTHQIDFSRLGTTTGNTMTVRTSFGARNLPLSIRATPIPYVLGRVSADDNLLDSIAFSRGRFTVVVPGTAMLVIPAWAEPARVVEDCRS